MNMSADDPAVHWAQWSFETDMGYHAQVREGVAYVRNARREPHMVVAFTELAVEVGERVRVCDETGWHTLDIGKVCNMLRVHQTRT